MLRVRSRVEHYSVHAMGIVIDEPMQMRAATSLHQTSAKLDRLNGCWRFGRQATEPCGQRDSQGRDAGFTLLEILVVVAILGLLIGLVAPAALRQLGGARVSVARQSIERLGSVLDIYKLDTGSYPSTDEGLAALVQRPAGVANWNGPYVRGDAMPMDPWNHAYVYRKPSSRAGKDFDLCSTGPNQDLQGSGMICNP